MNIPIGTPITKINSPISPIPPKLGIPGIAVPAALADRAAACKPNTKMGPTINIIMKTIIPDIAEIIKAKGTTGTFLISFKSSKPSFMAPILGTNIL